MSSADLSLGSVRAGSVLVTDGEQRAALAVVRSLGAAGWRCIVGSRGGRSLAGASRFATAEVSLPDPAATPESFGARVADVTAEHAVQLVIPIAEPAVLAVLAGREMIPAAVPFPALSSFEAICDKQRVLGAAKQVGIRVPRQLEISTPAEAFTVETPLPVVLKPHRSICTAADGTRIKLNVRWAHTTHELYQALNEYPDAAYPILVQEAIAGPGVGVFLLMQDGRAVARFGHRRIREKPPSGGVSVLRQSESVPEFLYEKSLALLREFDWSGVAMVEYKLDERSGDAVLMEINGRFWGSLQLAIDAGVDFPVILAQTMADRKPARVVDTFSFVRSRWFWGDVDHVISMLRDPRANRKDRIHSVAGWVSAFGPGYKEEVFRWTDPRPFLHETIGWLRQVRS